MRHLLSITIVACAIVLNNVECLKNPGRLLDCWHEKLKFDEFPVDYYFSSRNQRYQKLTPGAMTGKHLDFVPHRRTIAIVHGFVGFSHEYHIRTLVEQLLRWKDVNIVVLDWRIGAGHLAFYPKSVVNTEYAAIALRELFIRLAEISGTRQREWQDVHFIGHSLGAHVVGQAAAMLKKVNLTIDRVTGLDPAEPCFRDANSPLRLKSSSARFVDVIHTDGAKMKNDRFGLLDRLGHADFYVNGGSVQPGCMFVSGYKRPLDDVVKFAHSIFGKPFTHSFVGKLFNHTLLDNGICHHNRVLRLFIESVIQAKNKTCKFWARPWQPGASSEATTRIVKQRCNEKHCIEMGINAELYNRSGSYYVKTSNSEPFCTI